MNKQTLKMDLARARAEYDIVTAEMKDYFRRDWGFYGKYISALAKRNSIKKTIAHLKAELKRY